MSPPWATVPLAKVAWRALEARGFDLETLVMSGVESVDGRTDLIAIPFLRNGEIVNRKYRSTGERKFFAQDPGAERVCWNRDCLFDASLHDLPVIVTEGELDAIAAIQAGNPRTISVPDGAPAEKETETGDHRYPWLDDAVRKAMCEDAPYVIIATDDDEPGWNLRDELVARLGRSRCKWVRYPSGSKDLADVLTCHGEVVINQILASAEWMPVSGIYAMDDLPPPVEDTDFACGIPLLQDHWRLRKGSLTVVTGIPGHGKTSLVQDVIYHMAKNHGWRWAVSTFEQRINTTMRRDMRTWFNGCRVVEQSPDQRAAADRWIDAHFRFVMPGVEDDADLPYMFEKWSTLAVRWGIDGVIVDPWNELDHMRPRGMSETDYIGEAFRELRRFRERHRVHVIIVAHPAKIQRLKDGSYPVPSLYDIAGSAHWSNKADIGIVVHRSTEDLTEVHVRKCKDQPLQGRPGIVPMNWSFDRCKFVVREDLYDV